MYLSYWGMVVLVWKSYNEKQSWFLLMSVEKTLTSEDKLKIIFCYVDVNDQPSCWVANLQYNFLFLHNSSEKRPQLVVSLSVKEKILMNRINIFCTDIPWRLLESQSWKFRKSSELQQTHTKKKITNGNHKFDYTKVWHEGGALLINNMF